MISRRNFFMGATALATVAVGVHFDAKPKQQGIDDGINVWGSPLNTAMRDILEAHYQRNREQIERSWSDQLIYGRSLEEWSLVDGDLVIKRIDPFLFTSTRKPSSLDWTEQQDPKSWRVIQDPTERDGEWMRNVIEKGSLTIVRNMRTDEMRRNPIFDGAFSV